MKIKKIEFKDFLRAADKTHRGGFSYKSNAASYGGDKLLEMVAELIDFKDDVPKAVLGIDIYHYSEYPEPQQTIVPFLFMLLYRKTCEICIRQEAFLFQKYENAAMLEEYFISTGDGGFQIFETPLHAVAFAINFSVLLRAYNAFNFYPALREAVGELNLRYAITYDTVFNFESNFYGTSIINNSRMLGKDSLNRVLIDDNTHRWFVENIYGVENLQVLTLKQVAKLPGFSDYSGGFIEEPHVNGMFVDKYCSVTSSDIMKIGTITAKNTKLSIYNLHLQIKQLIKEEDFESGYMIISLGNLNVSGI